MRALRALRVGEGHAVEPRAIAACATRDRALRIAREDGATAACDKAPRMQVVSAQGEQDAAIIAADASRLATRRSRE